MAKTNDNLDRNGLVIALTNGVGHHFGRASRRAFYQQLERLEMHPGFQRASPEEQQCMIDLLAFASFYQTVIVPVNSSARFVSVVRKSGANHLRVSKDKLGGKHAAAAFATSSGFRILLEKARVPNDLLVYATLNEFIGSAREFYRERQR